MAQARRTVGNYEIWEPIAQGAMAIVYRGFQPSLGRVVAIKMLLPELAQDLEFKARFRNEAGAIAQLSHPNIIRIHDIEVQNETYYIIMEFIAGPPLARLAGDGRRVAPLRAADLAHQAALALAVAHEQGIVHRDVKPDNLLLTPTGTLKVMDFGVAKVAGTALKTQAGVRLGTPAYMSPEQARGQLVDARSDLYSLGCVLFETVTGQLPFSGPDPFEVALRHIREQPPEASALVPGLPPALAAVIARSLAKDPAHRFQSAGEMASALAPLADKGRRRLPQRGRSAGPSQCPSCGQPVKLDFEICPGCGAGLRITCPSCDQKIETGAAFCPYCWVAPGQGPSTRAEGLPLAARAAAGMSAPAAAAGNAGRALLCKVRSFDPAPLWRRLRRPPPASEPAGPAAPGPPAPRACPGCGGRVAPGFVRCPYCGRALEE